MDAEQRKLREWFEREQAQPRNAVVGALDGLGLRPGDRIADIGCGPGVHIPQMLARIQPGGTVTGIDTNPDRLAVGRELLGRELDAGAVQLIEGDLHALDPDLQPFDLVWMSLVLHHEEIPVDVIRSLREIVRPGGRIAILDGDDLASFPLIPWPPQLELAVRRAVVAAAGETQDGRWFGRRFTARSMPAIFADAGLDEIQVRGFVDIEQGPLTTAREAELRNWFRNSFGSRIRQHLSDAELQSFDAAFDPDSPDYLLDKAEFVMSRTWFLGVGTSH